MVLQLEHDTVVTAGGAPASSENDVTKSDIHTAKNEIMAMCLFACGVGVFRTVNDFVGRRKKVATTTTKRGPPEKETYSAGE